MTLSLVLMHICTKYHGGQVQISFAPDKILSAEEAEEFGVTQYVSLHGRGDIITFEMILIPFTINELTRNKEFVK